MHLGVNLVAPLLPFLDPLLSEFWQPFPRVYTLQHRIACYTIVLLFVAETMVASESVTPAKVYDNMCCMSPSMTAYVYHRLGDSVLFTTEDLHMYMVLVIPSTYWRRWAIMESLHIYAEKATMTS